MEKKLYTLSVVAVFVCVSVVVTSGQAYRFVLDRVDYPNGSTVLRSDIGEGDDGGLQCTTDKDDCCRASDGAAAGQFYFPNGNQVPISGNDPSRTYYRDRGTGFIRLNRRLNGVLTGQFRCEIPDASGTLVNLFINIVDELPTTQSTPPATTPKPDVSISISITASGTNTAGETYNLECSATVTGSTDQPTISWMDPMNNPVSSEMVNTTGSMSTLTFNPLAASHAGTYTCRVTAGGVTQTQTSTVIVNVITAQVTRSSSGPLTAGQTGFSLSCDATGTENLNTPTFTSQWRINGGVISGQEKSTLSLSPLTASNAGEYNCSVTVSSTSLSSAVTDNSRNTEIVSFQLAAPTSVTVTNGSVNVGSDVTLTCTVELSPAVDVPVTVNTVWTGPAGFMSTNTAQPVIGSTTTYTSTATVNSFGRYQSGDYTCTATVSSTSSFLTNSMASSSTRVIVGVYLSLKGVIYPNNSVISITEIGETNTTSNNGLQCITDRMPCCVGASRAGEWFFPDDGGMVPPIGSGSTMATTFYRNRSDNGKVNLNRVNTDVMMPTGRFCCVIPDATGVDQTVCANIVPIDVMITPSGSPTAGETFSLECSFSGISDNATFQWLKGSPDNRTQLTSDGFRSIDSTSTVSQLQFSPLRASHGGLYTCQVMVEGVEVEGATTVEVNLPAPTGVTVTLPVDTVIAGSSPNLTCTVELSPAVDVPVTVDTVWSGPAITTVTTTNLLMMESLTRYIILGMVDEARNGSYTCQATVSSSSQFVTGGEVMSGSTIITVGPLPSPIYFLVSRRSPATSISLTWDQPQGADAVNSYKISYTYEVIKCIDPSNPVPFPPVTLILNNGSLRGYTIMNSSTSPVHEDSNYIISVTAVNSVTESNPSNSAFTTTAQAAPGVVQSLNISSVNVTNITIQWDRVDCQDRNGPTDSYRVVYYPTSDPLERNAQTIPGTGVSDRMFTVTGLPPRTGYTFEVLAINPNIDDRGARATLIVSTSAPQNFGFLLNGQLYPNNSVVTRTDIGSVFSGPYLFCLTPSTECCSASETPNEATVNREWYLPDERLLSSAGTAFGREQVSSAVRLYRNSGTSPTGVFRCDVPVASGTSQSIFVGIYPLTDGSPSITSVLFDRDNTTLTCTSTGGPPTTVTWRKDGVLVDNSLYQQSQRVVDTETATYENILFNDDISNFVGTFSCEVSNVRNTAQETVELNGVSITRDQFTVAQSATATCKSDTAAARIEWLTDGVVVESATSIQQLDLVFSLVNDSIHNQDYTCRVTREGGMTATQNFTVKVDVPPDAVIASVSRSGIARAGMIYSLTCTVSKIAGLVNSPTATWTIGGVAVSNGNDITVSSTTNDTSSTSTLIFDLLRTSHEGIYTCVGSLSSPALDSPLTPSAVENHRVQISTPDVSITIPPGPLYAGRTTPLTLICIISINLATDTPIAVTNMDITWLNGSTSLLHSDDRVAISPLSGSQQPFTINLTLSPLSTFDNASFTCRARARPLANVQILVTASEQGERTVSVPVVSPLPPSVSIVHFSSPVTAGQSLTLICSATVQEDINGSPTLMWTRDGVEQSTGSLFSFEPLLTSHGGLYTCTARLNISEAGVDVSGTNTTNVSVQIPPPMVTISGSPSNRNFFQGLELTFTCSITLDGAVDTLVTVQGTWNRNRTELVDGTDEGRITVSNPPLVMPPYQTTVSFSPLNVSDAGAYECSATVTPQNATFITETTASNSRNITVAGFPTPEVDVTDEGILTAGFSGYTLICNTSREPDLPTTTTLAVEWLDPSGSVISNGTNFSVIGCGPTTDNVLTSRLTFNSLYTSQSGEYTCRSLQTIVGTVTNHPETVSFTVTVKLSAPLPLMFRQSRNSTLYAGTNFSLTCLITQSTTGVDTEFTVESFVTGPRTSELDRVSISQPMSVGGGVYEMVVTFKHLIEEDSGSYNCSATIASSQDNVIFSNYTAAINVEPLQPSNVIISPLPLTLAGEQRALTCTATVVEFLQTTPTLIWRLPGNTGDTSIPMQSTFETTSTITLNFNPLHTSHGGVYVCEATINIGSIPPQSQTANETVLVQIPPPVISFSNDTTPYNGTNFTLTGVVQLHPNVDTDVTVSGIWSNGDAPQDTTSPPYLTNLTFQPLATNSSGEYTFTASLRPSDNSPFIVGNSGNRSYNVVVRSLPSRPPTITVASRHPSSDDGCGETMTLNCTANQVDNLFTPPTIIWRDPNGMPVSNGGGSNPRMDPKRGQLIFSDITSDNQGTYTCQAVVNIPQAQIMNYFDMDTTEVNTNSPGAVQNLICSKNSTSSELSFSWELPTELGSEVIDYRVEVKGLHHRDGTREVVQFDVDGFNTEMKQATINLGLAVGVPYNITVRALNLAGCGEVQQIYCFTQEGEPPPPVNVVLVRFDSTSIVVSWTKFTLVELKGLANYIVTYNIIIVSRKRQQLGGTITVPWTENRVIISDLQPGADYDITVSTTTTAGMSAPVQSDGDSNTSPPSASTDNSVAIISGLVAVVLIVVTAITIPVVIALVLRNRRDEFKPNQKSVTHEPPAVMLSDIYTDIKEKEAGESVDHEYEILDKYSQPLHDVEVSQAPPPKSEQKMEDCELTQCPAYVPVTHGNQQAETSLMTTHSTDSSTGVESAAGEVKGQNRNGKQDEEDGTYEILYPN